VLDLSFVILFGVQPELKLLEEVVLDYIFQLFLIELHELVDYTFLVPENLL
jgi:hypothetical protein